MSRYYDDYLAHHGIKGQKWGVRRYQNPDGSWTAEGKKRRMYRDRAIRAGKTSSDVNSIIDSLNADDRDKVLAGSDHYLNYEEGSAVVKRILLKSGDKPIAFFDILEDDADHYVGAMAVAADEHGKGYGAAVAKKGTDWLKKNGKTDMFDWGVRQDNTASIALAKKYGLTEDKDQRRNGWTNYSYKH